MDTNARISFRPSVRVLIPRFILLAVLAFVLYSIEARTFAKTYTKITGASFKTFTSLKKTETKAVLFAKKHPSVFNGLYAGLGTILLYLVTDVFTTKYTMDVLNLKFERGIFFRKTDSIDLVKIQDHDVTRNPIDLILGLKKIHLVSRDESLRKLTINGVGPDLADKVYEFIKINSTTTIAELRKSEELKRSKNEK